MCRYMEGSDAEGWELSMVDPVTVGAVAAGVASAKNISAGIGRVFGPAADEVGSALARFTGRRLENVGRVVENADAKGDPLAGSIPMRVAIRVLEDGSTSDDEVVVEYLGGVLASSRTEMGRDDRGNTYTALVARLSTYHLRSHYIWYSEFRRLLVGAELNIYDANERAGATEMFMPYDAYYAAMDFGPGEHPDALFSHSIYALEREGLIDFASAGGVEHLKKRYPNAPSAGMILSPTIAGIELYLWALGKGQLQARDFLTDASAGSFVTGISVSPTAVLVKGLPAAASQADDTNAGQP